MMRTPVNHCWACCLRAHCKKRLSPPDVCTASVVPTAWMHFSRRHQRQLHGGKQRDHGRRGGRSLASLWGWTRQEFDRRVQVWLRLGKLEPPICTSLWPHFRARDRVQYTNRKYWFESATSTAQQVDESNYNGSTMVSNSVIVCVYCEYHT